MKVSQVNNTQRFCGLHYSTVYGDGLKLVKKELPKLQELGKKYDINLSSFYDSMEDTEYIDVYVHHLNKKPDFLTAIFSNRGWADCQIGSESIVDVVEKAISTLK